MSTSPLRPEDTPFGPPTKFCMWAKFADIINCAKFHLHWLSRFWAPGVRKSPFPIDLRYRSYNSVRTNVLHYDKILNSLVFRTLLYVNIYGSYKLSKNIPDFLAHPVYITVAYSLPANAHCPPATSSSRTRGRSHFVTLGSKSTAETVTSAGSEARETWLMDARVRHSAVMLWSTARYWARPALCTSFSINATHVYASRPCSSSSWCWCWWRRLRCLNAGMTNWHTG